ncbi:hypothetical protein VNO77_34501 [Canavalia gladiata]|uniref:Uncharacterized protein n=1 Tax=Canavalia gladiata TaxID=3824 RepID=A0AAN9PZU8_CANGL
MANQWNEVEELSMQRKWGVSSVAPIEKILGIFNKLVNASKELNNPTSLNSCTKPKLPHEVLRDFMSCNSSNTLSMSFGNDA